MPPPPPLICNNNRTKDPCEIENHSCPTKLDDTFDMSRDGSFKSGNICLCSDGSRVKADCKPGDTSTGCSCPDKKAPTCCDPTCECNDGTKLPLKCINREKRRTEADCVCKGGEKPKCNLCNMESLCKCDDETIVPYNCNELTKNKPECKCKNRQIPICKPEC